LAACGRGDLRTQFATSDVTGVAWGRDFHLIDQNSAPRSVADYRGRVLLVFFGYSHCPDECPTTLAKMAQAVDRLGTEGSRVQGLFVSMDPERDTLPVLARYVAAFHSTFVGLTGNEATIAETAREFKLRYDPRTPEENGVYLADHTAVIFVFDERGRLRLLVPGTAAVDTLVHDLDLLLQASGT
jgi:protein SCO1/2